MLGLAGDHWVGQGQAGYHEAVLGQACGMGRSQGRLGIIDLDWVKQDIMRLDWAVMACVEVCGEV